MFVYKSGLSPHQQEFQKQGKSFYDKVRLYSKVGRPLVEAKESGTAPYAAIELVTDAYQLVVATLPKRDRPK